MKNEKLSIHHQIWFKHILTIIANTNWNYGQIIKKHEPS